MQQPTENQRTAPTKGARIDAKSKRARQIRRRPSGPSTVMGVTLSKPDKALWPNAGDGKPVTKLDLARYFEQVGEWMLPHLAGRPCSLVRAPDGIGGQQFFQRHAMAGMSELFDFVKVRGDKAPYVQIDRVEALAAVAQIGALELHPWNCARNDPESAGRLVFDLDPAPDVKFDAVIAAAHDIRERLEKVGLVCFCKSTGGKGLHVVTPVDRGQEGGCLAHRQEFRAFGLRANGAGQPDAISRQHVQGQALRAHLSGLLAQRSHRDSGGGPVAAGARGRTRVHAARVARREERAWIPRPLRCAPPRRCSPKTNRGRSMLRQDALWPMPSSRSRGVERSELPLAGRCLERLA